MFLLFLGTIGCGGVTNPEAPTPEQQLEQANQTFLTTVASSLQEAATKAGIKFRTDNFVAIRKDSSIYRHLLLILSVIANEGTRAFSKKAKHSHRL